MLHYFFVGTHKSNLHLSSRNFWGKYFRRPARPLETQKARNDCNCKDHCSGSQMACKNQTAIRCRPRLQIMQKSTRTTWCKHWKFGGRDVWTHQQCFLRWNGDNFHSCLQAITSSGDDYMPACKLHKHQRVSSGLSDLMKRVVWTRCGRSKTLGRYAAENCWRKRQQKLEQRSLWKPEHCEDCFYYCSERNNVVVLSGTLKVQSFILTEVSDCGLLIVVTSSTFLKRKDMLKEKSG